MTIRRLVKLPGNKEGWGEGMKSDLYHPLQNPRQQHALVISKASPWFVPAEKHTLMSVCHVPDTAVRDTNWGPSTKLQVWTLALELPMLKYANGRKKPFFSSEECTDRRCWLVSSKNMPSCIACSSRLCPHRAFSSRAAGISVWWLW